MKELKRYLLLDFPVKLKALKPDSPRQFGEMTVVQMLDHLRKAFVLSYSGMEVEMTTPPEHIERLQAFLASDKPIRPGAQIPKEYSTIADKSEDFEEMKYQLLKAMVGMLAFYENNRDFKQGHPIFGELSIEQWLQLHKKHTEHHLRQFGVE